MVAKLGENAKLYIFLSRKRYIEAQIYVSKKSNLGSTANQNNLLYCYRKQRSRFLFCTYEGVRYV